MDDDDFRRIWRFPCLLAVLAFITSCRSGQESSVALPTPNATSIYKKTVQSVVGVRVTTWRGERSGTGIILSSDGLILTSNSVCPIDSEGIKVWLKGPRRLHASIVGTEPRYDISLIRIKCDNDLKTIPIGQSSKVQIGEAAYTIGNFNDSIILNDEAALSSGVISGAYQVPNEREGSNYVGPVLETSAAVGIGMEGAPCLDAEGRLIGVVTTNYSASRRLGLAIPIDELKPVIESLWALWPGK